MNSTHKIAVLLVGYQNDYFGDQGLLREVVQESVQAIPVLENTVELIETLPSSIPIIATPIHFTPDYQELIDPVGILKNIKDRGALQADTEGAALIAELVPFRDRIMEVHGKRGFNAFAYTDLDQVLKSHDIDHVVIAGTITSICIDSTGRYAHENGYKVTILSDCTAARTIFEQEFYCENIFPVYAEVKTRQQLIQSMLIAA